MFSGQQTPPSSYSCKISGSEAVVSIPDGERLEGEITSAKMKLLQAWIEIHKEVCNQRAT